jgi:tetratricopeptide (TPR) repeat protein
MIVGFVLAGLALTGPAKLTSTVESGDRMFLNLDYASAIRTYISLEETMPDNADLLWRLARVHVCVGDITPRDQREPLYRVAETYARRAVLADSNNGFGHTWLAAALGNIAMYEGSKTKVRLSHEIKVELERALALNASDDIARSILGSFYRALGNISWIEKQLAHLFLGSLPEGGYEEAEASLKEAIRLAPGVIRHRHELGLLYLDMGREDDAAREFHQAVTLPVTVASDRRRIERMNHYLMPNDPPQN